MNEGVEHEHKAPQGGEAHAVVTKKLKVRPKSLRRWGNP